jgi:restriction endonuclease S subunit
MTHFNLQCSDQSALVPQFFVFKKKNMFHHSWHLSYFIEAQYENAKTISFSLKTTTLFNMKLTLRKFLLKLPPLSLHRHLPTQ